jgi:hypothetical protein
MTCERAQTVETASREQTNAGEARKVESANSDVGETRGRLRLTDKKSPFEARNLGLAANAKPEPGRQPPNNRTPNAKRGGWNWRSGGKK